MESHLRKLLNTYVNDMENPDVNFDMALAYHDMGHTASAVSYYLRTAERTTDDLLKYESLIRAAMCYTAQGIRRFTVKGLLQNAITVMPKRPEAYFDLVQLYEYQENDDGRWFEAYTLCSIALEVVDFEDAIPLKRESNYPGKFALLFQKGHVGWHCGMCDESREIFSDLLINWKLPTNYLEMTKSNLDNIGGMTTDLHRTYSEPKIRKHNITRSEIRSDLNPDTKINIDHDSNKRAIIVDNFYKDPDAIRKLALEVEYDQGGIGRGYIGNRSKDQFFFEGIKESLESLIGQKITTWEDHYSSGRFQYNPSGEPLVYHCDGNRWAAMVFLTPDAPAQCGTALYRHKESGVMHNSDPNLDAAFNQKTFLDGTPYEEIDRFGNVYNRLVIFDGGCIHAASEYFGSELNDCRLWHMFFFDTEK